MSSIEEKETELALMRQKVNLLDKEIKKDQLLKTIARLDDEIKLIKENIARIEQD